MKKSMRIMIIFALPVLLLLPANVQGHIVSEAENLNLALTPEEIIDQNKDGIIQLRNSTQLFRISQINDTFLFDPILISFQLYNMTSNIDNSSYFNDYASNLKIELIVTYFIFENSDYLEYTNETYLVNQKDPETIDFLHVLDPSVQITNTRDMVDNSTVLELFRDEPNFRINVDFQLRFSLRSLRNPNMDLRIHSTIRSYHTPSISNNSFHNKITGHLASLPVMMTINRFNFLNNYRLYIPIPLDLTSNFMRATLASHNITTIPKMKMKFSLRVIDLENSLEDSLDDSFEEDPIKLQISHNQTRLKQKHVLNQTYEFTHNYVPGQDQILVFDLVNYGNSIDIIIQSVVIQIPALFFDPDYNTVELIWMYIVAYKYLAIFLSVTILAAADREHQRRAYEEEYERVSEEYIRSKKTKSVFIDDEAKPKNSNKMGSTESASGLSNINDDNQGSSSNVDQESEKSQHTSPKDSEIQQQGTSNGTTDGNIQLVLSDREREKLSIAIDTVFNSILRDASSNQNDKTINQLYPLNPQRYLPEPSAKDPDKGLFDDLSSRNSISPKEQHLPSHLPTQIDSDPNYSRFEDNEEEINQSKDFLKSQEKTIGNHTPIFNDSYADKPNELPYEKKQPDTQNSPEYPGHISNDDIDYAIEEHKYYLQRAQEADKIHDFEQKEQATHFSPITDNPVVDDQTINFHNSESTLLPEKEKDTSDEYSKHRIIDNLDSDDQSINQDSISEHAKSRKLEEENLDSHQQTDYSTPRSSLEEQLNNHKNDYSMQKGNKVIPDVDTIEEIWDYVIDGFSIDFIHRLTGIDRSFIFHLTINMMHLNELINSVELRKKYNQNIDKVKQIEKKQIVTIMSYIYDSLVVMADKWTSDDIERVVKTKDLTVRDEFEQLPKGSSDETEESLVLSLGQTNIIDLQAMILSKLAFYAKFNDIGSDMWENGVVLSGRNSSGLYKLTVKDILGTLVKNTHVHNQLRSMLPAFKLPKGEHKRSDFKGKQIEDLEPKIRYALESDSLKMIGEIRLESLPVSSFAKIWKKIIDVTVDTLSEDQDTDGPSIRNLKLEIETSTDLDLSDVISKTSPVDEEVSIDVAIDPTPKIEVRRHQPSFENFRPDSLSINGNFIPIHLLSHEMWKTNMPVSADHITNNRRIDGKLSSYEKHRISYSILHSIKELEDTTLFSLFNNIIMNLALEARYSKELLDTKGLTLSKFKEKSSRYAFAVESWLTKPFGNAIHPDNGKTIGDITIAQFLDINNSLRLPKQEVSSTGRDYFTALYSIISWKPIGNERPDEVYERIQSQLRQNNYDGLLNDKITDSGINSFEAFQVLSDIIIGKLLANHLLSLTDEDLKESNDQTWNKIPSRYLKYDFRTSQDHLATNEISNGSDLIVIGPQSNIIFELKSWGKSFTMGRGYTDIVGITNVENGIIKPRPRKGIPPYTEYAGPHKLSISGFAFGTDISGRINPIYNLPAWAHNLVRDKIIYPWAMQGQDPVYAHPASEYVYASMIYRSVLLNQSSSPISANNATEDPSVIWAPKYPDVSINPIVHLVSSPAKGDFGISLIDRMGRNWKSWYLGHEWYNPGDKWGPSVLTLGRHLNKYDWDMGMNLVRNGNGSPSINLLNAVAIRIYKEPYSYTDEKSGQLYNPRMKKGTEPYESINAIARKLLSFAEQTIHLAIFEHMMRTKQRIDIKEESIIHKQLGVTLGSQKAIENAINNSEMDIHNMYDWDGSTSVPNPNNEYKTKLWTPDGRIIDSKSHDSVTVVLHGRMAEEPGSGKINKFKGKEHHGYVGLRKDQMLGIPARIAKILFEAYNIDIWRDLESLYAMVPGSKLQRTNELAELKLREVELLLQTYHGLNADDKWNFRAINFESNLGIPIDSILKTGEVKITNSLALWRLMPHEFREAFIYELGKIFTGFNTQGLVSNWGVNWDNPGESLVFRRTIRGLEMTGGILPELFRERNQRVIHEPGTTDRYDVLRVRPEADIANYGYVSGPKNQRFSDKGLNRLRAIAFNKIGELKMEELCADIPNYHLGLKSVKVTKLDNGLKTSFFKNTLKSLEFYLAESLNYKGKQKEIPMSIQGKIFDLLKSIIHSPEVYQQLRFDGVSADTALPNHLKSGLVKTKDKTFRKTYGFRISDPEQFMRMSSDFWTFTKKEELEILDFFNPNYRSAEEMDKTLWEKIVTGKKVNMKDYQLRMIKQFDPPSNKIHRRYSFQKKLIRPSHLTEDGITITRNNAFDGLVKGINPQDFPGGYFGDIIRLNSFLKRNPTPPIKTSTEFSELRKRWSNVSILSMGNRIINKIKVEDIAGMAEYLANTVQLDDYIMSKFQNKDLQRTRTLIYLMKYQKLDRYSDQATFAKVERLLEYLIEHGNRLVTDSEFATDFGPFWWLTVLNS